MNEHADLPLDLPVLRCEQFAWKQMCDCGYPDEATGEEIERAKASGVAEMLQHRAAATKASGKSNGPLGRSAVLLARIVLVAFGVLWIGFGIAALVAQWPHPSWIVVLVIVFGVGCVALGCFDSSAAVVATAVWTLFAWS